MRSLAERIAAGVENVRHENIRKTLKRGRPEEISLEDGLSQEEALWAFTSRMRPIGTSGFMVHAGLRALIASACPFNENGNDTWADALISAGNAMEMELRTRSSERPRMNGLVPAAWVMAETVRQHGFDYELLIFNLDVLSGPRHKDKGTQALMQFLAAFK